jgi:hypothetical protein
MLHKPLLLAIDALGLEAWQMHGEALVRVAGFGPGEATALQTWLAGRTRRTPCRILVNLADEAYETEDLPCVRGADRKALIARRTVAWFPHPEFARAWSLGPVPEGRKGFERFLFAGLERSDELRPWVDAVRTSGARITRLIPAANLIPAVLAATPGHPGATAGPQLVAGFGRAGLRITLVAGGRVHFSRLVGRCTLADAAQSPAWLQEIERTRDYLLAQHRLPADTPVPVRVLEMVDAVPLAPESVAGAAGGASAALSFLPSSDRAVIGSADGVQPAQASFDTLLVRALLRAPADLGWQPAIRRSGKLPLSARMLALASVVAATVLGGGAWYVERDAVAAEAAARAARHQPVVEPLPPAPPPPAPEIAEAPATVLAVIESSAPDAAPPQPCPAPEAPAPALAPPPAPAARRIEGILLRPDGEALVWLDGTLMRASDAGLQATNDSDPALSAARAQRKRLRVGDQWVEPALPAAASPASAHEPRPRAPEPAQAAAPAAQAPDPVAQR